MRLSGRNEQRSQQRGPPLYLFVIFIVPEPDQQVENRSAVIPVALVFEPTPVVNLLFAALIVIVGLFAYWKMRKTSPLYVTGAFLLFGISHFGTVIGLGDALATPFLILRIVGYILIVAMLCLWYVRGGVN
jgi:hypothetical protein